MIALILVCTGLILIAIWLTTRVVTIWLKLIAENQKVLRGGQQIIIDGIGKVRRGE